MRLLTGDETGVLKDVWIESNSARVFGDVLLQDRAQSVTALSWAGVTPTAVDAQRRLLVGRASGVVETWECQRASRTSSSKNGLDLSTDGANNEWTIVGSARGLPSAPVAVAGLPNSNAHVAFCRGGDICVTANGSAEAGSKARWTSVPTLKAVTKGKVQTSEVPEAAAAASTTNNGTKAKKSKKGSERAAADATDNAAAAEEEPSADLTEDIMKSRNWKQTGRKLSEHKVSCGTVDSAGLVALCGGMEHDACLLDLETGHLKWQAKNVHHDYLQLRQPVWVTAVSFLRPASGSTSLAKLPTFSANDTSAAASAAALWNDDSSSGGSGGDRGGTCFLAGTAFGQLRLYDARAASRRPVSECPKVSEFGVTAMSFLNDGYTVVVGDKGGGCNAWDCRTWQSTQTFGGSMGSVRGITVHPTLPYMACVGLDRTSRVFNLKTGKLAHTSYLKQRLSAVLFEPEGVVRPPTDDANGEGDSDDYDESEDELGGGRGGGSTVEYYEDGGNLSEDDDEEDDEDGSGEDVDEDDEDVDNQSEDEEEESGEEDGDDDEDDEEDSQEEGSEEESEPEPSPPPKKRAVSTTSSKGKKQQRK